MTSQKRKVKKKVKSQLADFYYFLGFIIAAAMFSFWFLFIVSLANAEEIVVDGGDVIAIQGDLTQEQREAGRLNWVARQYAMRREGEAEIQHSRDLEVEVAKHQLVLDEAGASASDIYVSSYSESSSNSESISRSKA